MDMKLTGTSSIKTDTAKSSTTTEKAKDNVSVAEQKEVVSKSGNDAVRSMGMALLSAATKTAEKTKETTQKSTEHAALEAELTDKYLSNDPKMKSKPAIDKLFSGSEEEVSEKVTQFKQVTKEDESISPVDFIKAKEDLAELKARGLEELTGKTESEQLSKLSKARHLLGEKYSVDFATEMVDLDATFDEYQELGMNDGVASASREVKITSHPKASAFGIVGDTEVRGLANLAAQAYSDPTKLKPERLGGYEVLDSSTAKNGFSSTAFRAKDGSIVIAYRGSDDVADIKSDLEMINGTKLPEQFYDAEQFYEDIRAKHSGARIVLTGHSLGGALSQLVAAHNEDAFAVTFNAPGTKDIITRESGLSDSGNIYNIIVDGDKISGTLAQPGVTQLIDGKADKFGSKLHPHAIGNCL